MAVHGSTRWVWIGRVVFGVIVVGLVVYLFVVGLDKADKVGSSIGCVLALEALLAPYLLPRSREEDSVPDNASVGELVVEDSGDAHATGGGKAITGAAIVEGDTDVVRVVKTGIAVAHGVGSVAITGSLHVPRS